MSAQLTSFNHKINKDQTSGNRLSKIYTRTGDDGSTGMADGSRVSKADHLFSVMGDVDELDSISAWYALNYSKMKNRLSVTVFLKLW